MNKTLFKRKITISLGKKFLIALLISFLLAAITFDVSMRVGNFLAWRNYLDSSTTQERIVDYSEKLQKYVTDKKISIDDTDKVIKWSDGRSFGVVIYQDSDLIYSPEWFEAFDSSSFSESFRESDFYENWFSGDRGFEQYLTEEARDRYSEKLDSILQGNSELYPRYCVDGTLLVAFVDYSEEIARNYVLGISFVLAIAVIAIVMIAYFSYVVRRVNKLAQNVKVIGGGDLDAPISVKGNDDIASLARNVDSMRYALIDNMTKERRAWESNSALITAMSHDIRTPLTVLMGYLDLIEFSDPDDNEANAEYVAICRENAHRLKKLSDDLFSYFLVFGKHDMGLEKTRVCISGEISAMMAEHIFLLEEQGYSIATPEQYPESQVDVDMAYFSRVIDNIFSNIGKYADKSRDITVSAQSEGGIVSLRFENYIRTDKNLPESNRIGLKTCSKIMEQMDGKIEIDEHLDRFTVTVTMTEQKA